MVGVDVRDRDRRMRLASRAEVRLDAVQRWVDETPDDFVFAVKASRYLTHMKKLKDPEEPARRLLESLNAVVQELQGIAEAEAGRFPGPW